MRLKGVTLGLRPKLQAKMGRLESNPSALMLVVSPNPGPKDTKLTSRLETSKFMPGK